MIYSLCSMIISCNISKSRFENATIMIEVKDCSTNNSLEGVQVRYLSRQESDQFAVTNAEGICFIKAKSKKGSIECQLIGYKKIVITNIELNSHKKHRYSVKMSLLTN